MGANIDPGPIRVILLCSIGTAGDIHPFVAIALALQRRGHQVVVMANPYFQERIIAAGVGFWSVGTREDYLRMVTHPDLVTPRASINHVLRTLILSTFREQADAVRDAVAALRPEIVVAHHICLGASAMCERLGIPVVLGVLAPLFWLSRHERVIPPVVPYAPAWVHSALRRVKRAIGPWTLDRPVNRLRAELGVPPTHRMFFHARGGDGMLDHERLRDRAAATPVLGLWSPHFRGTLADDPIAGEICGFCFWDRPPASGRQLDEQREIAAWMDDGDPPVLVTLGSSVSHHGREVYQLTARASADLGARALMLTGDANVADLPSSVRAVPYAAYSAVMPRASVILHHAGIGTLAAAMRAGRPSVILPFANDEFDNTHRARNLGVAAEIRPTQRSLHRLTAALDVALHDQSMQARARELGERIWAESGDERAAVAIERILASSR